MTISFNLKDELVPAFIAGCRWKIDRPDLNDNKIMAKYLKQQIARLIDAKAYDVAIGVEELGVKTAESEFNSAVSNHIAKQDSLMFARQVYEEKKAITKIIPTIIEEEV